MALVRAPVALAETGRIPHDHGRLDAFATSADIEVDWVRAMFTDHGLRAWAPPCPNGVGEADLASRLDRGGNQRRKIGVVVVGGRPRICHEPILPYRAGPQSAEVKLADLVDRELPEPDGARLAERDRGQGPVLGDDTPSGRRRGRHEDCEHCGCGTCTCTTASATGPHGAHHGASPLPGRWTGPASCLRSRASGRQRNHQFVCHGTANPLICRRCPCRRNGGRPRAGRVLPSPRNVRSPRFALRSHWWRPAATSRV